MNWIKNSFLGMYNGECSKDAYLEKPNHDWFMQYGRQEGIESKWKEIISLNKTDAMQEIDNLIQTMEDNSEANGFFGQKDNVYISQMSGFRLDDRSIYYDFFANLRKYQQLATSAGKVNVDGQIIFRAIKDTVEGYLGKSKNDMAARIARNMLTEADFNDSLPSISRQKGKGTGVCTEMSAIAHNLWLLAGKASHFISTHDCQLKSDDIYARDGHTFCIVQYEGKYRMFDMAYDNFGLMEGNPIDTIKNGQALRFGQDEQNVYISNESAMSRI